MAEPTPVMPKTTNCDRCGVRLRIATERNDEARPIRKSLSARGYCANCAITEFLKAGLTMERTVAGPEFPEAFRLEHVQEQVERVLIGGKCEAAGELDWNEIIANWELPFPFALRGYN